MELTFTASGPVCRPVVTVVPRAAIGVVDASLAQQSRQIEGRQRHMGAEHHHLLAAQKRRRGVEHVAMSVARHRHHHRLRARQRVGTACGDARMKAARDGTARHQRRTRGERRGAPAGGRPQGDVVPIAAQQGRVPKGDRASSKDGNLHGTTLQFCYGDIGAVAHSPQGIPRCHHSCPLELPLAVATCSKGSAFDRRAFC